MAIGTPFHSRTSTLNTSLNWRQWSGYFVASAYEEFHDPEYHAIRNGAGLIDVSPLYKYDIRGGDAERLVDRLITRDATKCKIGQVIYTPWCDDEGKVVQDGTFQRLEKDWFRVTAAEPALGWFQMNAPGMDVELSEVSTEVGALALQGPRSREILNEITNSDLTGVRFFWLTRVELAGIPAIVSRTGYTGDLGYEVWVASDDAVRLWDALTEAGKGRGLVPSGMLALDLARIEAGFPLIDVDFVSSERAHIEDQKSTPAQIGLGWAVNFKKPFFIGKRALLEERQRGVSKKFMGLEITWEVLDKLYGEIGLAPQLSNVASRVGVPVYFGGRQVGKATSSCWSTLLKKFLALATLDTSYAEPGTYVDLEITVEYVRKRASARVVPLPFFEPERKRA